MNMHIHIHHMESQLALGCTRGEMKDMMEDKFRLFCSVSWVSKL